LCDAPATEIFMSHTGPRTTPQDPDRKNEPDAEPAVEGATPDQDEHEGATDADVGDRTGPGAGYDQEPEQEPDQGGVA
jgi:hypothetical protein